MQTIKSRIDFDTLNYTNEAVTKIIPQLIGKPFRDENTKQIGKVVNAYRIDDSNIVELVIESDVQVLRNEKD